jgi:hypothetical protein
MANEDIVDMTPCPPFTPKPWPPPRNRKAAELIPITESANVEMGDEFDAQSFAPALPEEELVTKDESAVESGTTPRPKKQKAQAKNIREVESKASSRGPIAAPGSGGQEVEEVRGNRQYKCVVQEGNSHKRQSDSVRVICLETFTT